jgi:hypothetical protein
VHPITIEHQYNITIAFSKDQAAISIDDLFFEVPFPVTVGHGAVGVFCEQTRLDVHEFSIRPLEEEAI